MISLTIAHKYADPDCAICEGEGVVTARNGFDIDEDYCECVKRNKANKEAEDYAEGKRQDNEN